MDEEIAGRPRWHAERRPPPVAHTEEDPGGALLRRLGALHAVGDRDAFVNEIWSAWPMLSRALCLHGAG